MEEAQETRYWCHNCEEVIVPMEPEKKCPDCDGGFVEEMGSEGFEPSTNVRSERNLSLWAPLLLGMMGGSSRRSRPRRDMMDSSSDEEEGRQARIRRAMRDTDDEDEEEDGEDSDRELEDLIRRRRRRGSSLVRLLQTLRDDLRGLDDAGRDRDRDRDRGLEGLRERRERERARRDRERERERARERDQGRERTESLILINSNNEAILLQGTFGADDNQEHSSNSSTGVSLGDYFLGPGLDLLLQRLADSDLNRSGTPPAKKESVAALPTVNVQEILGCTVCLEEFEMGTEAKEMPCQHKFHSHCILPWLELHSSCPVCRFQLPTEESKNPCESGSGGGTVSADGDNADGDNADGDNAESSSSDIEGTDHNEDSQPGSPMFPENITDSAISSVLDALFPNQPSLSSSDENNGHASES